MAAYNGEGGGVIILIMDPKHFLIQTFAQPSDWGAAVEAREALIPHTICMAYNLHGP